MMNVNGFGTGAFTRKKTRINSLAGLAGSLSLLLALTACGGSANSGASGAGESIIKPAAADLKPVAGDPTAPQPLEKSAKVTIVLPQKAATYANLLLADALGEFDKENLDVTVETAGMQDSLMLLSQNKIDAVLSGPTAGWMNLVETGADIKAVFPGGGRHDATKIGFYARRDLVGSNGQIDTSKLGGTTASTLGGSEGQTGYALFRYLNEQGAGLKPGQLKNTSLPMSDAVTALKQGSVGLAMAAAPFNAVVRDDECCVFLKGAFPGYSTSTLVFGERLLRKEPEVGAAITRAMARTHLLLQGNYLEDPKIASALAAALDIPASGLAALEPARWDPAFKLDGLISEVEPVQDYWRTMGALKSKVNLKAEQLYDTSFIELLQ